MQEMFLRKIPEDMRPWECNVNGVKYVYPAGTEQNVPAEVAAIIDAYWEKQEVDYTETGISFNDLRDRPFGESTEVLFDQRVEFTDGDGEVGTYTGPFTELLEADKTYSVTYNGNVYKCVPLDDLGAGYPTFIGNTSVMGGADTGEPFAIVVVEDPDGGIGTSIISCAGDTSATVKIEKSVIHTIDPKFLPGGGSGGGVVEIPITWNDDQEDFTVGNTFADMRKAVDGGSTVVLKDNLGRRYHLQWDEGGGLTFTNTITNMNGRMIFQTFSFGVDGYERYYSEIVTTQEDFDVIHSAGK